MGSLFGNTIIQKQEEESSLDKRVNKIINNSYNVDLNAFYRAFVANNADPLKLGRVQIRIPSIHGTANTTIQTSTDSLPWASPGIWNCAGNDMGQYLVPEVGTVVFVTFEQGDQTKPIYFGGVSNQMGETTKYIVNPEVINKGQSYAVKTNDFPEDLGSVYNKMLFKSAKGNEVVSSDLDGKEFMYLVDASGQSIEMENFGPYLKRRGSVLGFSGKPRMKLSTNRGSDMVLTNEAEIMTTRTLEGQLDDIKILNKTDDLNFIDGKLNKLLRDKFKDFGNYSYNKNDKVFNLNVKLNDVLDLTTTSEKVYDYQVKMFEEFELVGGLFLQVSLVEREDYVTRALISYRNTNTETASLDDSFILYFAKPGKIDAYVVTQDNGMNLYIGGNTEGNFYATIWGSDLYDYTETWGFDYREEFRFIVDTLKIPDNNTFCLDFTSSSGWVGYIKEIDWGDGEVSTYTGVQDVYLHTYKGVNSYKVIVRADSKDFRMPYVGFLSRGIVSIESPVPINANSTAIPLYAFGRYGLSSTLAHINKYVFRNYLLYSNEINLNSCFARCNSLEQIPENILEGFSSVSSLANTFYSCYALEYIPEDFLEGKDLSEVNSVQAMFNNCIKLEKVPDFLFDNETLLNVSNASSIFSNTGLIKIPKILFKHMKALRSVNNAFSYCKDLGYIPEDLLKYNTLLQSASYIFRGCLSLIEVPRYLFKYNRYITSLSFAFEGCSNLEYIYSDMFSGLVSLVSLSSAFEECSNLAYIVKCNRKLFSDVGSSTLDISSMFKNCIKLYINIDELFSEPLGVLKLPSINIGNFLYRSSCSSEEASTVPALWNISSYFSSTSGAFGGSGNNSTSITNYSSIPGGWK